MTDDDVFCHRCDLEMVDDGEWFTCPCCRSRTRGRARQQAIHDAHMGELGMTAQEYHEHCMSFIDKEPADPALVERLAKKLAADWRPACEHDTVNPFLPAEHRR